MRKLLFVATVVAAATAPVIANAFAALAVDSNKGTAFGWGAGYPTNVGPGTKAHQGCGTNCRIVMQWDTGCGAFAADQAAGSNISAIATGRNGNQAKSNAFRACGDKGGFNCKIRVWACDRGALDPISGGGP